jgi:hypothetical protein
MGTGRSTVWRTPWRRWLALFAVAGCALGLPSCESGGNFTLFGYSTAPNYDLRIHTVRVPIFENRTYRQRVEFDLTQAVVREIEQKTPYKVVSGNAPADTELRGTIISLNHNVLNRNQLNEIREVETVLTVEVIWRDLRTGEVLSKPSRRPGEPPPPEPPPTPLLIAPDSGRIGAPTAPQGTLEGPSAPPPAVPPDPRVVPPALVRSVAGFIPEVGESPTTAYQKNVDRLAVEIVSLMEKPW